MMTQSEALAQLTQTISDLQTSFGELAGNVTSLADAVVTEIAQINEKLSEIGSPDLSEPMAQLAALADSVNQTKEQVVGIQAQVAAIVPDDIVEPEPEPLPEPLPEPGPEPGPEPDDQF